MIILGTPIQHYKRTMGCRERLQIPNPGFGIKNRELYFELQFPVNSDIFDYLKSDYLGIYDFGIQSDRKQLTDLTGFNQEGFQVSVVAFPSIRNDEEH